MDPNHGPNSDAAQRQRLVRILRDPDGYFAQARREAREHARQLVSEQLDGHPQPEG
ncbi:MAG TPA: hypothetical protein VGE11_19820 [Pseudonocardia sp.]